MVRAVPYPTTAPETATPPTPLVARWQEYIFFADLRGGRVRCILVQVSAWQRSHLRARSTGDRVITGMEEKLAVVPPIPSRRYMISPPLPTDHFSRAEQVYHSMKIDFAAGVFHRSIEGADQGDGRVDEGCRCASHPCDFPSPRAPTPSWTHTRTPTHAPHRTQTLSPLHSFTRQSSQELL